MLNETTEIVKRKGEKSVMETVIWFVGAISLYFALQLWILPKLGIST